jgi:uncharacterized coiled-coil DUF342 family protein
LETKERSKRKSAEVYEKLAHGKIITLEEVEIA